MHEVDRHDRRVRAQGDERAALVERIHVALGAGAVSLREHAERLALVQQIDGVLDRLRVRRALIDREAQQQPKDRAHELRRKQRRLRHEMDEARGDAHDPQRIAHLDVIRYIDDLALALQRRAVVHLRASVQEHDRLQNQHAEQIQHG